MPSGVRLATTRICCITTSYCAWLYSDGERTGVTNNADNFPPQNYVPPFPVVPAVTSPDCLFVGAATPRKTGSRSHVTLMFHVNIARGGPFARFHGSLVTTTVSQAPANLAAYLAAAEVRRVHVRIG